MEKCIHDYRYVSSQFVDPKGTNELIEVAKVICVKCGEVKNTEVVNEKIEEKVVKTFNSKGEEIKDEK